MKRIAILAIAALAGAATANVTLYGAGRVVKDQGITLKSWGSGSIAETDETALEGTTSVRVTTRNYFQGGVLEFGKPFDLAASFTEKNNLLMVSLRMADGSMTMGGGMLGGKLPGGMGGPGGMAAPGGPPPGVGGGRVGGRGGAPGGGRQGGPAGPGGMGGPGGMMQGGPGGPGGMGGGAGTPATLKQLRVVVTTTDGLRSEAYLPVGTVVAGASGWRTVGLPLQAISGLERTNKVVKAISFSGDTTGTFFVGELKILNDATPLYVEPNVRELNLALGDEVELYGIGTGGASQLEYAWDFDDKDGVQVDATGQSVRRRFRKAGTYVITLTLNDLFGLKKSYSTTIKAIVNP